MPTLTSKLSSFLLAFVLVTGLVPSAAFAASADGPASKDSLTAIQATPSAQDLASHIEALIAAGDSSASEVFASNLSSVSEAADLMQYLSDDQARYASIESTQKGDSSLSISLVIYAEPQWSSIDELASEPMLTEDATLQSTLEDGWDQLKTSINIASFAISKDDFQNVYFNAIIDAPDFFNVRTYFSSAGYIPSTGTITSVNPGYVTTNASTYASMKTSYEAAVSEALATVPNRATDLAKVYVLHDWLCARASYNNAAASENSTDGTTAYPTAFTSYGCMVEQSGVCQSYSLALSDLLERVGIENTTLFVLTSDHGWNMAKVDGNWFHIDSTFDDQGSYVSRKWFMKSDTGIQSDKTHRNWTSSSNLGWDSSMVASDTTYDSYDWSTYNPTADIKSYKNKKTSTSGNVTLTAYYDDPVAGQPMTFHLEATGGSGSTKYYMGAPSYYDIDESYEVLCDPTYVGGYTAACERYDYMFTPTASGTYWLEFNMMDTSAGVYYNRLKFSISISDSNHPAVSQIVSSAVAQAREKTNGSDYEMALWLHDWLLDQLEYDKSLYWCSAESGLTRGLGTCESYQRAYAKLMDAAGISNARMEGNGHTWNAIKLDGAWYQVDPTWDDSSDDWYAGVDERHLYFGLTDELMAIAHSDHAATYTADGYGYRSSTLADNYAVKSGDAAALVTTYAATMQTHLNASEGSFSIAANNTSWPPSIYGIVNGVVAFQMNQTAWDGTNSVAVSYNTEQKTFDFVVSYPVVEPDPDPTPTPTPNPDPTPTPTPTPDPDPDPTPVPTPDPDPTPDNPSKGDFTRLAGDSRYDTMTQIASTGFTDGSCETAILATGEKFADALAASSLAGVYDAPVILSESNRLSSQAKSELSRLGVKTLYVLGGESAISEAVTQEIEGMQIKVVRLYGSSRQDTAIATFTEVLKQNTACDTVIIASGEKFADALSISPYAYSATTPILLTDGEGVLTQATVDTIRSTSSIKNVIIVGGTSVVDESIKTQLGDAYSYNRLWGKTRYESSTEIAKWELTQGMSANTVAIATGSKFPDALSGAALCGVQNGLLLLVDEGATDSAISVLSANKDSAKTFYVFGGASSVPDSVVDACKAALGW